MELDGAETNEVAATVKISDQSSLMSAGTYKRVCHCAEQMAWKEGKLVLGATLACCAGSANAAAAGGTGPTCGRCANSKNDADELEDAAGLPSLITTCCGWLPVVDGLEVVSFDACRRRLHCQSLPRL